MTGARWQLEAAEIAALVSGTHGDPFARLGVHKAGSAYVARTVIPDAESVQVFALDGKALGELKRGQGEGYFEGKVALKQQVAGLLRGAECERPVDYRRSLFLRSRARAHG